MRRDIPIGVWRSIFCGLDLEAKKIKTCAIGDFKPDVLLQICTCLKKRAFTPDLVKAQLGTICTLATFFDDTDSKALAESYGPATLLDKMSFYNAMLPAIQRCHPELNNSPRKVLKRRSQAA